MRLRLTRLRSWHRQWSAIRTDWADTRRRTRNCSNTLTGLETKMISSLKESYKTLKTSSIQVGDLSNFQSVYAWIESDKDWVGCLKVMCMHVSIETKVYTQLTTSLSWSKGSEITLISCYRLWQWQELNWNLSKRKVRSKKWNISSLKNSWISLLNSLISTLSRT